MSLLTCGLRLINITKRDEGCRAHKVTFLSVVKMKSCRIEMKKGIKRQDFCY